MNVSNSTVPSKGFILGDKLYNRGKWVVMVLLPAASTLYWTLGNIWGLPNVEKVCGTISALAVFLGAVLMISSKSYEKSDQRFEGEIDVETTEEGKTLYSLSLNGDPAKLQDKDQVTFKVNS